MLTATFVVLAALVLPRALSCELPPGLQNITFTHGGFTRRVLMYVPERLSPSPALVLALHGVADDPESMNHLQWDNIAETEGLVVAYPAGLARAWNAGWIVPLAHVDDVSFLREVAHRLAKMECGDPSHTYITGFSNGGFMSYRAACEASDVFAAAAPLSGNMGDWIREFPKVTLFPCDPARHIPIMHWHGKADTQVFMDGRLDYILHAKPIEETVAHWAKRDKCDMSKADVTFVDGPVTCRSSLCDTGASDNVTLCLVDGMNHQVYNGSEYHVWDFFRRFSL